MHDFIDNLHWFASGVFDLTAKLEKKSKLKRIQFQIEHLEELAFEKLKIMISMVENISSRGKMADLIMGNLRYHHQLRLDLWGHRLLVHRHLHRRPLHRHQHLKK